MGFFDKLKASVGIGGAKIELHVSPVATGGSSARVRAIVRGGKLAQQLHGVDLSLEIWPERRGGGDNQPASGPSVIVLGRMPGSAGQAIPAGSELTFEMNVDIPSCQDLYAGSPDKYASLVVADGSEDDPTQWSTDGPLPMVADWESSKVFLIASADIPGAIDPSAKVQIHVIPEAAGTFVPFAPATEGDLLARLGVLGAERVFVSNASDTWFAWWSRGDGRVVAYGPVKAVCSVRPEGVVRAYSNANIPEASRLARLPTETAERMDGGIDEARRWASDLALEAGAGVILPRPVGNAWFVVTSVNAAQ